MTTAVKEAKRKADREARAAKRQAAWEAKRQAREAQERERNGGLTDDELNAQKQAVRDAKMAKRAAILAPLAEALNDDQGGFRQSVAIDMKKGFIPKGRGLSIALDILAKFAGRRGSKAYNAEWDRLAEIINQAEAIGIC